MRPSPGGRILLAPFFANNYQHQTASFLCIKLCSTKWRAFLLLRVTWTICRGDYVYPGWANGIGWLIAMTAILSVPLMAVVTVVAAYRKRPEEGILEAFHRLLQLSSQFVSNFQKRWKIMLVALNREKQHTADWRKNAAKANGWAAFLSNFILFIFFI